ncbi:MAG: hypothetical protein US50_C0005G0003 [Candidatus Nomurabacteria bacterium GW2011_GWB1_37_5]|uniref:Transposase IS200-like domain-containing protein n=1 Tax=Candidatus Nomurabacteria bacterium GW2011_GWB1_37_5 TaxID=1618742 RepID=A0A0G0H0P4_9BACT|nr:MAG: hypothetical protein US50_C0005G0003 [Candidatus Nomurabacteria bacterium GW2011_GWB1_37_5]
MPRTPRVIERDGIYHVFNRGVEKRKIYMNNQDFSRFCISLELFNCEEEADFWSFLSGHYKDKNLNRLLTEKLHEFRKKKLKPIVEILAFCLMPNHFHFILREIVEGGISKFMTKLGGYCTYFNLRHKRVGSLFQSRFKSVPIKDERQLGVIFNYVHTNPVELIERGWKNFNVKDYKMTIEFLNNYKWSSYGDYIGESIHPFITRRDFFHDFIGNTKDCRNFTEEWVKAKAQILSDDDRIKTIFLDLD